MAKDAADMIRWVDIEGVLHPVVETLTGSTEISVRFMVDRPGRPGEIRQINVGTRCPLMLKWCGVPREDLVTAARLARVECEPGEDVTAHVWEALRDARQKEYIWLVASHRFEVVMVLR